MDEVNILVEIEFNNNQYVFYMYNKSLHENKFYLGKIINNELITKLTDDEIKYLKSMMKYILLSDRSNHIRLNDYYIDGDIYTKYYDSVSETYYVVGKDSKIVNYLNYIFNFFQLASVDINNSIIIQDDMSNIKIKKRKKIDEIGVVIFSISVAFISAYYCDKYINNASNSIIDVQTINYHEEIDNSISKYEKIIESNILKRDLDKIVTSIKNNKNISEYEKKMFLSNLNFYIENIQYIDVDTISKRLLELKIKSSKDREKYNAAINVAGYYLTVENEIINFCSESIETMPKDILMHEFAHVHTVKASKVGKSILEALTELMQHEYFNMYDETPMVYKEHCNYIRILCEIIGVEPLKKFFFSGNINYIYEALLKIDDDYDKARTFVDNFDTLFDALAEREVNNNEIVRGLINDTRQNISNDLNHYFKLAKGCDIKEDIIVSTYMNQYSGLYFPVYYNGIEIATNNYVSKGYFSKEYIDKNSNLVINITNPRDGITTFPFIVTDQNRVQQLEINRIYIH